MSNIDKRALREAANAANAASWGNWEPYKPHKGARGYEVKVGVKAVAQHCLKVDSVFIAAANPATVLALLDELEAKDRRIAELSQKADIYYMLRQDYELHGSLVDFVDWQAKRIAEQRETLLAARSHVMQCARMGDAHANGVLQAIDRAAGKGEAS